MNSIVALESTIITHGMPYPQNLETSQAVEDIIKEEGATPATIAVIEGEIKVGLTADEKQKLLDSEPVKLSTRDLPMALAKNLTGGTTVAATMHIAKMAGINVFATGGIGGVHRGAETTLDVSADLLELSRTDVLVVCAGAKSILDVPKTLELLESLGVPVVGYQCEEFPVFFSRTSGLAIPHRSETSQDITKAFLAGRSLGLKNGMLVVTPIPEENAIDPKILEQHIEEALAEATRQGIMGKKVTPFLLQRLFENTQGQTLVANIALIKNNARLAAKLSIDLSL